LKEPSKILDFENYQIKQYEENDYRVESPDNWYKYSKVYLNENEFVSSTLIGIQIIEKDRVISDCLIGADGGTSGIHTNSTTFSQGGLIIYCSYTVFKLSLPYLNLNWKTIADAENCFAIYKLDKDFVVHGELEISRLDNEGKIGWKQPGKDIWTTAEGLDDFTMHDDYILATDWEYDIHKFEFNGNLLEKYKNGSDQLGKLGEIKLEKKWWELWK